MQIITYDGVKTLLVEPEDVKLLESHQSAGVDILHELRICRHNEVKLVLIPTNKVVGLLDRKLRHVFKHMEIRFCYVGVV